MDDETIRLLVDLHINNKRQGPGSKKTFKKALDLSEIDINAELEIADIGCGAGASTIALAENTRSKITAVDFIPEFLDRLNASANKANVSSRIKTIEADMADLPFEKEQFDVIWSEGAIYNIGFQKGIKLWKKFLKPGGVMVITEITWLTSDIPNELFEHWEQEYPEIDYVSKKIKLLEDNDYKIMGYFPLSEEAWLDEYYNPIEASLEDFMQRNGNSESAKEIVESEKFEIELFKKYKKSISYGCYVFQKT